MFGCKYENNGEFDAITSITGQDSSIVENKNYSLLDNLVPNSYLDAISSNGGKVIFKTNNNEGCGITYEGQSGNYRALYTSVPFNLVRNEANRDELMKIYMDYLLKNPVAIKDFKIDTKTYVKNISSLFISTSNKNKYLNFNVSTPSNIKGNIYTLSGKLISTICNKKFDKGSFKIPINRLNMGSGIFLLELECNGALIRQTFNNLK